MSYYIYNMGMPVRVDPARLLDKRKTEPLNALTRERAIDESDKPEPHPKVPTAISEYENEQQPPARQKASTVQDIMTKKVKTLNVRMTFADAWPYFRTNQYRHFPVLNDNLDLVGMLSDRDMLAFAASRQPHSTTIDKIMTTPVLSATLDTSIHEICQVMFKHHIGALPIIIEAPTPQLQGIVTRSDILRSMIKYGPMELWI